MFVYDVLYPVQLLSSLESVLSCDLCWVIVSEHKLIEVLPASRFHETSDLHMIRDVEGVNIVSLGYD